MPVRALVAAGEVFAISPESIRVALVRLCAQGTVERNERGFYRLAPAAQPVQSHVVAWTRTEERLVPWRGGWIGVHTGGLERGDRGGQRRRTRALQFLGFRELERDLFVRPDNLRGGVDALRDQLYALGLDGAALVFAIAQFDPATEDQRTRALGRGGAAPRLSRHRRRAGAQRGATRAPAAAHGDARIVRPRRRRDPPARARSAAAGADRSGRRACGAGRDHARIRSPRPRLLAQLHEGARCAVSADTAHGGQPRTGPPPQEPSHERTTRRTDRYQQGRGGDAARGADASRSARSC